MRHGVESFHKHTYIHSSINRLTMCKLQYWYTRQKHKILILIVILETYVRFIFALPVLKLKGLGILKRMRWLHSCLHFFLYVHYPFDDTKKYAKALGGNAFTSEQHNYLSLYLHLFSIVVDDKREPICLTSQANTKRIKHTASLELYFRQCDHTQRLHLPNFKASYICQAHRASTPYYIKCMFSTAVVFWCFTNLLLWAWFCQSLGQTLTMEDTVRGTVERKKRCRDQVCDTQIWRLKHQLDLALLKIENLQNQIRCGE